MFLCQNEGFWDALITVSIFSGGRLSSRIIRSICLVHTCKFGSLASGLFARIRSKRRDDSRSSSEPSTYIFFCIFSFVIVSFVVTIFRNPRLRKTCTPCCGKHERLRFSATPFPEWTSLLSLYFLLVPFRFSV